MHATPWAFQTFNFSYLRFFNSSSSQTFKLGTRQVVLLSRLLRLNTTTFELSNFDETPRAEFQTRSFRSFKPSICRNLNFETFEINLSDTRTCDMKILRAFNL